jgi:hypothetical protein
VNSYYDMLMDPTGGQEIYENPMMSWGWIGVDVGLGLFGDKFANYLGNAIVRGQALASRERLAGRYGRIRSRYSGRADRPSLRATSSMSGDTDLNPTKTARQRARKQNRRLTQMGIAKTRATASKMGKKFMRLGMATAALSFVDLGIQAFIGLASPGVSREVIEKDRDQVFGNEMLDTRIAYTQRQRSIQAIHDSQMSVGRALIGSEASYIHR